MIIIMSFTDEKADHVGCFYLLVGLFPVSSESRTILFTFSFWKLCITSALSCIYMVSKTSWSYFQNKYSRIPDHFLYLFKSDFHEEVSLNSCLTHFHPFCKQKEFINKLVKSLLFKVQEFFNETLKTLNKWILSSSW